MSTNRSKENRFSKGQKAKALKRAGFKCEVCGCVGTMATLEPHHMVPVSEGGPTVLDNCLVVCRPCHVVLHHK